MRLILTRPVDQARRLAARLAGHDVVPILAPMLVVRPMEPPPAIPPGTQAVLMTSANAVPALAAGRWSGPVLAVGDRTADRVRQAGFGAVESAGGTARDLLRLAVKRLDPAGGPVVYLSGAEIARDLAEDLGQAGFSALRRVAYRTEGRDRLEEPTRTRIADRRFDGVVFHSARTAAIFLSLVGAAGLTGNLDHAVAFCLGARVRAAAADGPWRQIHVAPRPDAAALERLIVETAAKHDQAV